MITIKVSTIWNIIYLLQMVNTLEDDFVINTAYLGDIGYNLGDANADEMRPILYVNATKEL